MDIGGNPYRGFARWNNAFSNPLPDDDFDQAGVSDLDAYSRKRLVVLWSFAVLILLSGCKAKPECDSFETRNAVLHAVSDDHE
jgi:hypothetical protein